MKSEINARGLNSEEIQQAIDSQSDSKKKNVLELIEDLKRGYIQLIKMDEAFAKEALETITKYHPDLLLLL